MGADVANLCVQFTQICVNINDLLKNNSLKNNNLLFINFGRVTEWLGRGLQNLLQRFESVHDLYIMNLRNVK